MTRAARPSRSSSARVVALLLAAGVTVSACTGTPAGAGHDHAELTGSHDPRPDGATATTDASASTVDHSAHGGAAHTPDATAATTGPPRPADPNLACGTTVLPDGEQITRYCDEGRASFALGDDQETAVDGGTCEDRGALFLAHFGANYSDDATARGDYLGLALEEMPQTEGTASIYALELTLDGYRQPVEEATVDVVRDGTTVTLNVTGELSDGRALSIEAGCDVSEA